MITYEEGSGKEFNLAVFSFINSNFQFEFVLDLTLLIRFKLKIPTQNPAFVF